jgi:hypothetical protein
MKQLIQLTRLASIAAAVSIVSAMNASYAALIYSDDFNVVGDIHNSTPDTRPGTQVWTQRVREGVAPGDTSLFHSDGSDVTVSSTAGGGDQVSNLLPFGAADGFSPGKIYTLTLDISTAAGSRWIGFGFMSGIPDNVNFGDESAGAGPWLLYTSGPTTAEAQAFGGVGINNSVTMTNHNGFVVEGIVRFKIDLDTTAPQWTATFSAQDFAAGASSFTQMGTVTYTTNPTIGAVGFGKSGTQSGGLDNFQLSVVPEPSTFVMLLGGLGVLAGFRRTHRGSMHD